MVEKNLSTYLKIFLKFMLFFNGNNYSSREEIEQEEMLKIMPQHIISFLNLHVYGNEVITQEMRPKKRANTIEYWKKALSFYMLRRTRQWDSIVLQGNPTRSEDVNNFIKRVKKFEVRGEGIGSKARRELEWKEFLNVLRILKNDPRLKKKKKKALAVLTLQWSLIGRIDDLLGLKIKNVSENLHVNGTLKFRVTNSKNIYNEAETFFQIVFPSSDAKVCPILHFSAYIEGLTKAEVESIQVNKFLFGRKKTEKIKYSKFNSMLKKIFLVQSTTL